MENKTNLEAAKTKLSITFKNKKVFLIIFLNLTYLILCPVFIISEKIGSGHYVPHPLLGFVYAFVWITNCLSMIFNLNSLDRIKIQFFKRFVDKFGVDKVENSYVL